MPHHNGVLVASLLLIACLGTNMAAFPEVWEMFRNDSSFIVAVAPQTLPHLAPEPEKTPPKTTSSDKPIAVEPLVPKKETPPMPVPVKEEPTPEPAPSASQGDAANEEPKPEPVKEEPKPEPAPSASQGDAANSAGDAANPVGDAAKAFAPIVPLELQDSAELESLLPQTETDDPFVTAVPTTAPLYAEEFKPLSNEEVKRPEPSIETIDNALAQPIVYESLPTIDQRIEEKRQIVPLPAPTAVPLRPLSTLSPTGPVKRLPLVK